MKIKEILKDIFLEMSDTIVLNEVCFNTNEDVSDDFCFSSSHKLNEYEIVREFLVTEHIECDTLEESDEEFFDTDC